MFHQIVKIPFSGSVYTYSRGCCYIHDTDVHSDLWQWSEMIGFGDLPSPREFAAASAIGNRKIVM